MTDKERADRNPAPCFSTLDVSKCPELPVDELEEGRVYILEGKRLSVSLNYMGKRMLPRHINLALPGHPATKARRVEAESLRPLYVFGSQVTPVALMPGDGEPLHAARTGDGDAVMVYIFYGPRADLILVLMRYPDGTLHDGEGDKVTLRKYDGEDQ
jgi:hypothetical protein